MDPACSGIHISSHGDLVPVVNHPQSAFLVVLQMDMRVNASRVSL
jgi:hypothetical protein